MSLTVALLVDGSPRIGVELAMINDEGTVSCIGKGHTGAGVVGAFGGNDALEKPSILLCGKPAS